MARLLGTRIIRCACETNVLCLSLYMCIPLLYTLHCTLNSFKREMYKDYWTYRGHWTRWGRNVAVVLVHWLKSHFCDTLTITKFITWKTFPKFKPTRVWDHGRERLYSLAEEPDLHCWSKTGVIKSFWIQSQFGVRIHYFLQWWDPHILWVWIHYFLH